MKSARRHKSLIPLSRDHHYALMLCLRIHRGLVPHADDPAWLQRKAEDVVRFLASNLLLHFKAEEEVLFPAMQRFFDAAELMRELLTEHRERLAERQSKHEISLKNWGAFPNTAEYFPQLRAMIVALDRHTGCSA